MKDKLLRTYEANSKGPAKKELYKMFKKNWLTAAKSEKDYELFKGKAFSSEDMLNIHFRQVASYIMNVTNAFGAWEFDEVETDLIDEVHHWEQEGGFCIYLSVLAYELLLKKKVFSPTSLQLVQGYMCHETRKDSPMALMLAKEHISLHCWLVSKGSVIDLTVGQVRQFFDFGDFPFFIGAVHPEMELTGTIEPKKIVNDYKKRFAKQAGLTVEQWEHKHISLYETFAENDSAAVL